MMWNRKKLVTHNGPFHADDVFACAVLCLFLENKKQSFKIIRTRDAEIIKKGDYVFDVGGIYDPELNRFDHHQKGGAGQRENGVPYSSFGLVWKKFGEELCGSMEVALLIDKKFVQPVDAKDNGVDICNLIYKDITPFSISEVFGVFLPSSLETFDKGKIFLKMVKLAKNILQREMKKDSDGVKIKKIIKDLYLKMENKRLLIIKEVRVSRTEIWDALEEFNEPLFAVYHSADGFYNLVAIRKDRNSFGNRKDLPKEWGALNGVDLQKISGVSDAIFCHKNLFLASATSLEGAIKLAEIALNNSEN